MKAIVCEMCSSHDVVKDGEFYVCQSCGTKYTVENAKKLMVEVEGSVKVDQSGALNNYLTLARQAKQEGNSQNAAQYYELAKTLDGKNWESYFYSVYYRAASARLIDMTGECSKVANCIPNTMALIKSGVPAGQQQAVCTEIAGALRNLRSAFIDTARNHYLKFSTVDGASAEFKQRSMAAYNMEYAAGNAIYNSFRFKEPALSLLKDCTNYPESHMDAVQLSKAISVIDPEAGQESLNKQAKRGIRNSIMYLIFAVIFIVAGCVIGGMGEQFNIVKWMGIGFGIFFALWGAIGLIATFATKKNFKEGKL